ncbi:MAG: hypothetical protein JSS75_07190 [Bacteroidetes bacterium]|nr:hypothetical protein [Bacteroidota bacterium]
MILRIDTTAIRTKLARANEALRTTGVTTAAEKSRELIWDANSRGLDVDGQPFEQYTPIYRIYGRERKGYRGDPPDLYRTGSYKESFEVNTNDGTALLRPGADFEDIAKGLTSRRKHIGLNPANRSAVKQAVVQAIKKEIAA